MIGRAGYYDVVRDVIQYAELVQLCFTTIFVYTLCTSTNKVLASSCPLFINLTVYLFKLLRSLGKYLTCRVHEWLTYTFMSLEFTHKLNDSLTDWPSDINYEALRDVWPISTPVLYLNERFRSQTFRGTANASLYWGSDPNTVSFIIRRCFRVLVISITTLFDN